MAIINMPYGAGIRSNLQLAYIPPDENKIRGQAEYAKELNRKMMNELSQGKNPKNQYSLIFALIGSVLGIIIATTLFRGIMAIAFGVIIGSITGMFIGPPILAVINRIISLYKS